MKPHLQCAEQQVSRSNLTKYCACHAERLTYSSLHMKPHLQCAEQQVSRSNLTKYCACHAERLAYLVLITYETSFTMRRATGVTIQPHQILRLSRRKTHLLNHHYIWNLIYNARSNRCHDPTSPNTAPATKNDTARCQRKSPKTGETSFPMRGRSDHDPTMIRAWSDHETDSPQPASQPTLLFELTTSIFYWKIQRFPPNLTFKPSPNTAPATKSANWTSPNTAPATKSATWTSPSSAPATKSDTWTSPSSAPATKSDTWTSPNTAPATKNDSTALSSSHMKRHFQCAEQQVSLSNLAKYCACHEKWHCKISKKISKNRWNVISNAEPIRPWSDHDPSMIRAWSDHETDSPQPASQPTLLFELTTSIFYWKIQRFAPNLTFKHSPNAAPATKSATWTSPNTAPATKSDTWTSPSSAPATKSDTWTSPSHEKWHLNFTKYCTCHEKWHLNFTKYCTCHEKWLDCCIVLTYETSFPMRGATGVTIQPPQILHLPRKMTLQDVKENLQKQVKRHFQCGADPTMIREWSEHDPSMKTQTATRLATEVTFRAHHEHFLLKNTTFRAQSYIQTFTKCCTCHQKCHLNFTKYCACHEKWHLNFTK